MHWRHGSVNLDDFRHLPLIPNLRFLVPLALDESGIVKPVMLADAVPAEA